MKLNVLRIPLFVIILAAIATIWGATNAFSDDTAFFKAGPLALNIPLKTARVAYGHDFKNDQELIFGETPVVTLWNRVEGTVGAVTSLQGRGSPTIGGDVVIGNLLDQWITLPADINIGGFGSRDFNAGVWLYGLKASLKLW